MLSLGIRYSMREIICDVGIVREPRICDTNHRQQMCKRSLFYQFALVSYEFNSLNRILDWNSCIDFLISMEGQVTENALSPNQVHRSWFNSFVSAIGGAESALRRYATHWRRGLADSQRIDAEIRINKRNKKISKKQDWPECECCRYNGSTVNAFISASRLLTLRKWTKNSKVFEYDYIYVLL